MSVTIGSLCTGFGGLEMAVEAVTGPLAHLWHAEYDPNADDTYWKRGNPYWKQPILTAHWPDTPNLGDLAWVDWAEVERPDIMCAGFPCKDLSVSGFMAGLGFGTRSGVWSHVAAGIAALRPRAVVIENVRGLLSTEAQRNTDGPDGGVESGPADLGTGADRHVLRALGAVLGDLSDLGFDAEWTTVAAADVGACHERERVFLLAWPADDPSLVQHLARRNGTSVGPIGGGGVKLLPTPTARDWKATGPSDLNRNTPKLSALRYYLGSPEQGRWGIYREAVLRWEAVFGRPAPDPVDVVGALSARFVEFMMGLPGGWVTDHVGRNAAIYALGDGVVPQQGAHALRLLLNAAMRPVGVAA